MRASLVQPWYRTLVRWTRLAVILPIVATGCKVGSVGEAALAPQPENPITTGQAKCTVRASRSSPLVVEWPAADRASLESRIGKGTVAVAYEGCTIEVLRQCDAGTAYRYTAVTEKVDAINIRNADELYAKLPVGAVRLEAQLERSQQLTVQTHLVGMFESDRVDVSRAELTGDCGRATHVITGVQVGAYEFFAGSAGAVSGGVGVKGGAGVGAKSEAARETLSKDGTGASCSASKRGDDAPPDGCGALIRIELSPILDGSRAAASAPGDTCLPSTAPAADGACAPQGRAPDPKLNKLATSVDAARKALASGDRDAALGHAGEALADFAETMQPLGSLAADYAAEAAFIQAEAIARDIGKAKLASHETEDLKAWLEGERMLADAARAGYSEVTKYKRLGWSYAAEFGSAAVEEAFFGAIMALPLPKKFAQDEELKLAYMSALEDKALPFEQRAREGYRTLIERAKRDGVESEWAHKAARRLHFLGE